MTDAGGAGGVKDRKSCSGKDVWINSSTMETGYSVCATSKKQNMICLSSGESELMALVGGECEGIATRDQRSKMGGCANGTIVLCTDSSAALGFEKRKGASRQTRHVDTKIYCMQAWAMEPGQRILKVRAHSQQIADCQKIMTPQSCTSRCIWGLCVIRIALVCVERECRTSTPITCSSW